MKKLFIQFEQLPDPLSRFKVTESDLPYLKLAEMVMDPYPYFYDIDQYKVVIKRLDGSVERNWREDNDSL